MSALSCLLATVLAILTIPLVVIWRISLTPQQNARRLRSKGLSYRAIGEKLNISSTTARRWVLS
jgi:ABC-type spermidine/putrescine transport system permease subunit II